MMAPGSSLVLFKQGLKNRLALRSALADVQLTYAQPTVYSSDATIWFGDAASNNTLVAMRGGVALSVEEEYEVLLHVQAVIYSDDGFEEADSRATAILAEVQKELAETPQTIPSILLAEFSGWEHSVEPLAGDAAGYGSHYQVSIRVRAHLTN